MRLSQIRIMMLSVAGVFSSAVLLAQDPGQLPTPSQQQNATSMQDSGTNANEVSQAMKDKMFLRRAAEGGIAEVKLGQLAAQKGASEEVKAFGQKMVDDHTMLNGQIAPVADSMGVRLPKEISKEDKAEYDKLNGLSGKDFDTEYLTVMVHDHWKDLREFRVEAENATDPGLKTAIENGEKMIREHLIAVSRLARDKGVPLPARGGNKPAPAPSM